MFRCPRDGQEEIRDLSKPTHPGARMSLAKIALGAQLAAARACLTLLYLLYLLHDQHAISQKVRGTQLSQREHCENCENCDKYRLLGKYSKDKKNIILGELNIVQQMFLIFAAKMF